MTSARRTRLDPDARRAQLVEIGLRSLSDSGLHDLSVEAVAEQAGISKALLFHYFGSKRRFQLAVVEAAAADLLARTEPDRTVPPAAQLRASIEDSVNYISARRELYVSLVRGAASGDDSMRAIFDATRVSLAERTLAGIGELGGRAGDPLLRLAVRAWLALTEEAIIFWSPSGEVDRERLIEFIESAFYRAVLGVEPP